MYYTSCSLNTFYEFDLRTTHAPNPLLAAFAFVSHETGPEGPRGRNYKAVSLGFVLVRVRGRVPLVLKGYA